MASFPPRNKTPLAEGRRASSLSMFEELSVFVLSKSILNFVATKNNGAIPFVSLSILARSSGVEPILSSIQLFIVSPMVASAFWSL